MDRRPTARVRFLEAAIVAGLLCLHAALAITSSSAKSAAFDEIAHLGGGYLQATTDDFRFNAESGTLPQRWAAWPLLAFDLGVPPVDHPARQSANVWGLGRELLYGEGLAAETLLQTGRSMIVLLSLALATGVYLGSRVCFGPRGALLSLALYALSPTMLAHARLITADLAVAFFFLLASVALWRLLERVTPARWASAALAVSGLLLSKMSGLLILPIAAVLILIRLSTRRPLELAWHGSGAATEITSRRRQIGILIGLTMAVSAVAFVAIWTAYGWRYSAQPDAPAEGSVFLHDFDALLESGSPVAGMLALARSAQLLPEAYLWGLAYTLDTTQERDAFLRGEVRRTGWWWFFPYAVAIKTPLALFGLLALAALAFIFKRSEISTHPLVPLGVLIAVYSAVAISSHLNIGHRHMLPIYPPLFILAGAAGRWLNRSHAALAALVLLCISSFAWESSKIRPHYLSYFNQTVGGPEHGYRHLVDSSLDWGQDLPRLALFLAQLRATEGDTPVFIAYFGVEPPARLGIEARWLSSFFPVADPARPTQPLTGGVYCISATLLQSMHLELAGSWNAERESLYQQRREQVHQRPAGASRSAAEAEIFQSYRRLRSARLFHFLRQREPEERVGYSIHVYRLSDQDVDRALNAPWASSPSP